MFSTGSALPCQNRAALASRPSTSSSSSYRQPRFLERKPFLEDVYRCPQPASEVGCMCSVLGQETSKFLGRVWTFVLLSRDSTKNKS